MAAGGAGEETAAAVERLRGVVRDCVTKHLYTSAIFFADKVVDITSDPADIYMKAQALFFGRHYRSAFHLLHSSPILLRDLRFRYLAAKCLEELKEWRQCLSILGEAKVDEHGNISDLTGNQITHVDTDGEDHEINITAAICFLRGKAYEALENRSLARHWYQAAIRVDPLCYEALERLVDNYMLTCGEESTLLSSLQFSSEDSWLSAFYSCLVKKFDKEKIMEANFWETNENFNMSSEGSSFNQSLRDNTDILACKAEFLYQCGEYQMCFALTSELLERDPFHLKSILVHLVSAVELGRSNTLYLMATDLVRDYPQKALPWFAVGCYYYSIKRFDQAKKHFSKATALDGSFAPAFLGSGLASASGDGSEQAMIAFRSAERLFPGCHFARLYNGMEYIRTHNFKLAEQLLLQANAICPYDPLVYNELGVVAYLTKKYHKAVKLFEKTMTLIPSLSEIWEPTLVNIAHALRKLKRYNEAISYYEKALTLSSRSLSSYAGLAYTCHLQDNFDLAITYYHKALWLKPDDQFCTEMLTLALEDDSRR